MSFDADFDYSTTVTAITADLVTVQAAKDIVDASIACLTGTTGYSSLTAPEIVALTAQQTRLAQQLVDLAAADAAITTTSALVASDKTDLYTFYGLCGESKSNFMIKLMYNHSAMLADADLIALLVDGTNTQEAKEMVGKMVVAKFTPNSSMALHVLYRTLSRLV
jgi:hypothetical protein